MVERLVRIQEVRGSIPLISTTNFGSIVSILPLFLYCKKSRLLIVNRRVIFML